MQATENHRIILIAGIPATGKSYFGEWLRLNHDFIHIDVEDAPSKRLLGVYDAWDHFLTTRDVLPLFSVLDKYQQDVVIDWGFPASHLPWVVDLNKAGAELWWFEGDSAVASSQFTRRNTRPILEFYAQVPGLRFAWPEISKVFGANCVKVLEEGRPQLTCEEIWERMNYN